MTRRIITRELQATTGESATDDYVDRVVKYVPADVVAVWIFSSASIEAAADINRSLILWLVFAALLLITPLWVLRQASLPKTPPAVVQALLSTCSFAVWVFALGGPFALMNFYSPVYGAVLIAVYSLAVGLVVPPDR
jgi:hypothetical protein